MKIKAITAYISLVLDNLMDVEGKPNKLLFIVSKINIWKKYLSYQKENSDFWLHVK